VDATVQLAPPVVAVMVVHEPGDWFDDALEALAEQDYGNLKSLFLLVGEAGDLPERIRSKVPNAFVRAAQSDGGYGSAVNEVLTLVEGENGFFCLLHDDVALEPNTIRLLVEELYRSNAGIVGPKLVEWSDHSVLQHVGLGVDRFGEIDPLVEPGEVDQEQHDAVSDVFAIPSACLLVRADLFRLLGGYNDSISFYGDDIDLCWRAHLSGARVVVVPSTRVRHLEHLGKRRPDLNATRLQQRHRMMSVATLTGARRLPLVLLQLLLFTLGELVVSIFTGKARQGIAGVGALLGLVPRIPAIIARRRRIAATREVPDGEVAGLQVRGSARVSTYLRTRGSLPADPEDTVERRWRQSAGSAPVIMWLVLIGLLVIGSRKLITGGLPQVGQILPYPDSPASMFAEYRSGWWGPGLGRSVAAPTGYALVALGSVVTLFRMGLWQTVALLGLLVVGYIGMWRVVTLFATARARIVGLAVFAAVPLPGQLLSTGRWGALACYAASPWVVYLLRRSAGIEPRGDAVADDVEAYTAVPLRKRLRFLAQLALMVAIATAFAPGYLLVVVFMGLALAAATVIGRASVQAALTMLGTAVVAAVLAAAANGPWLVSLSGSGGWDAIVGVPPVTTNSVGIEKLASFAVGRGSISVLALALYVPLLAALLVARSWRLTWAIRAMSLVIGFGWLIVLDDRGSLGFRLPEPGVMLAPVAVGLALAAACLVAAFDDDVLSGSFGWRQPAGILSALALVVGLIPGVAAVGGGRWGMPTLTLPSLMQQFAENPAEGDSHILWVGDPRVMPLNSWRFRPGLAFALSDDGPLTVANQFATRPGDQEAMIADALNEIATQNTLRGGRLLAPFGVRYIVVPIADGAVSTVNDQLPLPAGLVDALGDQLDLARPLSSPLNFLVYENRAWIPTRSVLTADGAAVSKQAGAAALSQADLSGAVPFAIGGGDTDERVFDVAAGTVHVAVPFTRDWVLRVNGQEVEPRIAFGSTTAFDVASAGRATLTYEASSMYRVALFAQLLLWCGLLLAASRIDVRSMLRRRRMRSGIVAPTGPVFALDAPIGRDPFDADASQLDDDFVGHEVEQIEPAIDRPNDGSDSTGADS
jgi:GT2 family glycosyltransferase